MSKSRLHKQPLHVSSGCIMQRDVYNNAPGTTSSPKATVKLKDTAHVTFHEHLLSTKSSKSLSPSSRFVVKRSISSSPKLVSPKVDPANKQDLVKLTKSVLPLSIGKHNRSTTPVGTISRLRSSWTIEGRKRGGPDVPANKYSPGGFVSRKSPSSHKLEGDIRCQWSRSMEKVSRLEGSDDLVAVVEGANKGLILSTSIPERISSECKSPVGQCSIISHEISKRDYDTTKQRTDTISEDCRHVSHTPDTATTDNNSVRTFSPVSSTFRSSRGSSSQVSECPLKQPDLSSSVEGSEVKDVRLAEGPSRSIEVTQVSQLETFLPNEDSDEEQDNKAKGPEEKDEDRPDQKKTRENEKEETVAMSPNGRFLKFDVNIGRGSFKTVFKGLDTDTGVHVAWCELEVIVHMLFIGCSLYQTSNVVMLNVLFHDELEFVCVVVYPHIAHTSAVCILQN